jgi:hypothetical protein
LFSPAQTYSKPLDDGLVLRSLASPADVERLAAFNAAIHSDESAASLTRGLALHHPDSCPDYWLIIEDPATGQIISSLCLIPWTWRYADVTLRSAEMGIVGTAPAYRRRGLVRALDRRFKSLLAEGGFHLSHIQGIAYFYRQLGYEYALPLEGGWHLRFDQVPHEAVALAEQCAFRQATLDDVPALIRLYDQAACHFDISALRDESAWRFLLEHEPLTATASETWLILDPDGGPLGYWRVERFGFGGGLVVGEASWLPLDAAKAVLGRVKAQALERGKPFIRLSAPDSNPLVALGRAWGAQSAGRYAWQIHVPDPLRLLRQIAPVLERRLAASFLAGTTRVICLDLYREQIVLRLCEGKITAVDRDPAGETRGTVRLALPPNLLAPLLLGWRDRAALAAAYPDVGIRGEAQLFADVLFPPLTAFLHMPY